MTRTKRLKRNKRKAFAKKVLKNIVLLIIGLVYLIYYILKNVNKLVVKGFKKLPRLAQVSIIYTLVGLSAFGIYRVSNPVVETIVKTETKIIEVQAQEQNEPIEEQKEVAFELENQIATDIYNTSIKNGLTHEQALLVVSISKHETGYWKSDAFTKANNFGGIMCNGATQIKSYNSYEEGLNDFVRILKNYYFDLGLTTVEQIGAKYCPVGAKNDPNGLNQYWVSGVSSFCNEYLNLK